MEQRDDIQHDDRLARLLGSWQAADPGPGFFATLPALIQERARRPRRLARLDPALALSGLTTVMTTAILVLGIWNIQQQRAFQDRLVSAAAAWSAEQTAGTADLREEDLPGVQAITADPSLGSAVEGATIENKDGYQLLDDLNADEIKQVVSALTTTKG
ncbi:MAG TPA: hypothetical protein VMF29_08345 [Candidatus Edwardsbacteria bacterium]|nr:hypothetical protein [Candidatus Edwardsbacteria bacterium]